MLKIKNRTRNAKALIVKIVKAEFWVLLTTYAKVVQSMRHIKQIIMKTRNPVNMKLKQIINIQVINFCKIKKNAHVNRKKAPCEYDVKNKTNDCTIISVRAAIC